MSPRTALVTGAAGFIGYHLTDRLLAEGWTVVGIDNLNAYYDIELKRARLAGLQGHARFTFAELDLCDASELDEIFRVTGPDVVVNLAAQAGVRYSIDQPSAYVHSNLVGFHSVLEACRRHQPAHLLYASSSSVYGASAEAPFTEDQRTDSPVSMYAATKKANEVLAHSYSHLFAIPSTGLRFFTVYGPLGRPDMAYFKFTDAYFRGETIRLYNGGDVDSDLLRDFTFIDDVVASIIKLFDVPPGGEPPHRVVNIGNSSPVALMQFVAHLESALSAALGAPVTIEKEFIENQPGDVPSTFASTNLLDRLTGFQPSTPLQEGLRRFAEWYVDFYAKADQSHPHLH